MKRLLDVLAGVFLALVLLPVLAAVAAAVRLTSAGPVLYWSARVGRHGVLFRMPKFRTMAVGTPTVATHLLTDPAQYLTPIGSFLRRSSLDELPQLWCVIRGEMSFVGPRPALFNQDELIALRKAAGVDSLRPGITGWAQVNGRDTLDCREKVRFDAEYLRRQSIRFDLHVLWRTLVRVVRAHGVAH